MQRLLGIASYRKLCALVLTLGAVVLFAGCSGKTTGATNITHRSATLHATGRCDAGQTCTWYWEYWRADRPRYWNGYPLSKKTPVVGPVRGATPDVPLSTVITGLEPAMTYRWVFCGSPNNGANYVCVGPHGKGGATTADPPPDFDTFTTAPFEGLAERSNGTSWAIQPTPNPSGAAGDSDLRGISCTSATACTAVGSTSYSQDSGPSGVALAERWNGTSWTIQATPNPAVGANQITLSGVSCTSATACTAVGSYTSYAGVSGTDGRVLMLAERWNGTSWTIQSTPLPSGAQGGELSGVSCTSATACTAVGNVYNGTGGAVTLAERWNGTSWAIQSTPSPAGAQISRLEGVSCTSATSCTAVGNVYNGTGGAVTLAERWNGTSWTIQSTPLPSGAQGGGLSGVSCTSATACTAVGHYAPGAGSPATLAERWNGTSWTIQATPNRTGTYVFGSYLEGISCTSATACTAVGYSDGNAPPVTLAMGWNGTGWTLQPTPDPLELGSLSRKLEGVSCLSAAACTAVGHG